MQDAGLNPDRLGKQQQETQRAAPLSITGIVHVIIQSYCPLRAPCLWSPRYLLQNSGRSDDVIHLPQTSPCLKAKTHLWSRYC